MQIERQSGDGNGDAETTIIIIIKIKIIICNKSQSSAWRSSWLTAEETFCPLFVPLSIFATAVWFVIIIEMMTSPPHLHRYADDTEISGRRHLFFLYFLSAIAVGDLTASLNLLITNQRSALHLHAIICLFICKYTLRVSANGNDNFFPEHSCKLLIEVVALKEVESWLGSGLLIEMRYGFLCRNVFS